jgi:hypothetical protein
MNKLSIVLCKLKRGAWQQSLLQSRRGFQMKLYISGFFVSALLLGACSAAQTAVQPAISRSVRHVTPSASPSIVPALYQMPYSPNPFKTPICASDPCYPDVDPNSATEVDEIYSPASTSGTPMPFGLGQIQEAEPGTSGSPGQVDTFPIYYASSHDPIYTVHCTAPSSFGPCSFYSGLQIHIPNGAHGSVDSDHHATVIEKWTNPPMEFDFWEFNESASCRYPNCGTSTPVEAVSCGTASGACSVNVEFGDLCTPSDYENRSGPMSRCEGAAVAAAVAVQPGMINPVSWASGAPFKHTIYVSIVCPSALSVWPAAASDGHCTSGPAEGEYIWLKVPDSTIGSLPTYGWVKTILHEMHDYGLMIVDTAGPGSPWNYYGLDNATFTQLGIVGGWTNFFNYVTAEESTTANLNYSDNASHLQIPFTFGSGASYFQITESDIEIVE